MGDLHKIDLNHHQKHTQLVFEVLKKFSIIIMKVAAVFFFAALALLHSCCEAGWAAPLTYGPEDSSYTALWGSRGTRVCYNISQVNNVGTLLCCRGLSFSSRGRKQWTNLGCSKGSVKRCVSWGSVIANPTVKCSGTPFGTMYRWKY